MQDKNKVYELNMNLNLSQNKSKNSTAYSKNVINISNWSKNEPQNNKIIKNVVYYKENSEKISSNNSKYISKSDTKITKNDFANPLEKIKPIIVLDSLEIVKKGKNELVIIVLNCRSIANKEEELHFLIEETKADIICLVETWLDSSHPKNAYIPNGYKVLRKDRSDNFKEKYNKKTGGGLAIIFKETINISEKKNLSDDTEEVFWLHVKEKNNFLLGIIYRPKYTTLLKEKNGITPLEKNLQNVLESHTNNVLVVGDFNIDMLDTENKKTKVLKNAYKPYGLKQLIKNPTRKDNNSDKATLIDHIWASTDLNIIKTGTLHGISDHLALYTKLQTNQKPIPKTVVKFRNFKKYNAQDFAKEVREKLQKLILGPIFKIKM